jgi:hypothetical protein
LYPGQDTRTTGTKRYERKKGRRRTGSRRDEHARAVEVDRDLDVGTILLGGSGTRGEHEPGEGGVDNLSESDHDVPSRVRGGLAISVLLAVNDPARGQPA